MKLQRKICLLLIATLLPDTKIFLKQGNTDLILKLHFHLSDEDRTKWRKGPVVKRLRGAGHVTSLQAVQQGIFGSHNNIAGKASFSLLVLWLQIGEILEATTIFSLIFFIPKRKWFYIKLFLNLYLLDYLLLYLFPWSVVIFSIYSCQDTEMKDTEIQKFYKVHEELLKMREETEENRKISRRETKARKAEEAIEKKEDFFDDEFDEDDDDDEEEEIETDSDDGRDHDPGNTRFIKLKKILKSFSFKSEL